MICLKTAGKIILVALAGIVCNAYADHPAGDVVTMKNGNIHIGNIQQASFTVNSEFGALIVPLPALRRLTMRAENLGVLLETDRGESIRGFLDPGDVRVSRLQDPSLPIALEDILSIDFGHQQNPAALAEYPSLLETNDGGILYVNLLSDKLTLEINNDSKIISSARLRYIDISLHTFEDELLTQLTLHDGRHFQGQLKPAHVLVQTPYLDTIKVSAEYLSRLTLNSSKYKAPATLTFSDSLRTLGNGPQMAKIAGGYFLRGDHQGDGDNDEQPLSEVTLRDYAIGVHEITFKEYDLYCQQSRQCRDPDDQDWGRGRRPVINVSWEEANAYVNWLADKTGKPYRLPSDAEWEYAHRAGNSSRYAWGNEVESARANCEGCGSIWDGDQTAPVGRFEPNGFGLYDTAGNVFEWVADCFHDRFSEAPEDGSPVKKEGCGKRVIRGGAWSFPPHEIRSANRWRDFPTRRSDDTGFRVAMDLDKES